MNQKHVQNPATYWSSFKARFLPHSCCISIRFDSRPTLDLTVIYNVFVPCTLFRGVCKTTKTDAQKYGKITPKTSSKAIKNQWKNGRFKRHEKTSQKDLEMEPEGDPYFIRKSQKAALERPRSPQGFQGSAKQTPSTSKGAQRRPLGSPKDPDKLPKQAPKAPREFQRTPKDSKKGPQGPPHNIPP